MSEKKIEELSRKKRIKRNLTEKEKRDKEEYEKKRLMKLKEEKEKIEFLKKKKEIEEKVKQEKEKKEKEDEKKREKIKLIEEKDLESKLNKWVLEEEKGQEELRRLLNQHPEDFQNVDEYFFTNRLGTLYKQLAIKKAARKEKERMIRIKEHMMKRNKPYIMKLM
tara:strand:+ start:1119 stop:1613 length:495 start_codon:yes stop_codon:yes gene_type:complete